MTLPSKSEAENLDDQARYALSILVGGISLRLSTSFPKEHVDFQACPNCGVPVASKNSPYCSDCCRERSAFIRQMRARIANGTLVEPQSQVMKGEQLWRLLGAGLPRRLAMVPEKARERVFKRAEGKCEICGAPATTIDNTGSG